MNKGITIGVLALLLIGIGFLVVTKDKSPTGNTVQNQDDIKEFTIKAFKFGYSPASITVNKGDKVKITIDNADVLHGIRIPDFGIKGNEVLEFTADKSGEFTWYCTNMCGEGHRAMSGKLIVK